MILGDYNKKNLLTNKDIKS